MNKNIIAIIMMIVGAGLYFTIARPVFNEAKLVKADTDKLSSALDNAEEIIRVREEVIRKYNSIPEADRVRLDRMIPSAVDNIRLVIDLNNLALIHHFALSNIRTTVPSNSGAAGRAASPVATIPTSSSVPSMSEPTLDKVTVSFNVSSTYDQFIDFMRALEADLRVSDVTHIAVAANDTGEYDFEVQFQTYWLRQ